MSLAGTFFGRTDDLNWWSWWLVTWCWFICRCRLVVIATMYFITIYHFTSIWSVPWWTWMGLTMHNFRLRLYLSPSLVVCTVYMILALHIQILLLLVSILRLSGSAAWQSHRLFRGSSSLVPLLSKYIAFAVLGAASGYLVWSHWMFYICTHMEMWSWGVGRLWAIGVAHSNRKAILGCSPHALHFFITDFAVWTSLSM